MTIQNVIFKNKALDLRLAGHLYYRQNLMELKIMLLLLSQDQCFLFKNKRK